MTPVDQSDQQLRHLTVPPATFVVGNGGRLLLLAVGGFLVVRLALALLQLG